MSSITLRAMQGDASRLVADCSVAPVATLAQAVASVYVDNVNVLGLSEMSFNKLLDHMQSELSACKFFFFISIKGPQPNCSAAGVRSVAGRKLLATTQRVWRLFLACKGLELLRAMAGRQLRVYMGHALQHCTPNRSLLLIFPVYKLVNQDLEED
eukprot:2798499-Karenia_brevis.AAC.1